MNNDPISMRFPKATKAWLARNGQPMAEQARNDLQTLQALTSACLRDEKVMAALEALAIANMESCDAMQPEQAEGAGRLGRLVVECHRAAASCKGGKL
jgi:hypothetical protein